MKRTGFIAAAVFLSSGFAAIAGCEQDPIKFKWNIHTNDQRISGDDLAKLVSGKKVKFKNVGTEHYKKDGSYLYRDNAGKYAAKGFKFYRDGSRCLDYDQGPRYDMYVVKDGKLLLINRGGGRFEATVSK